MSIHLLFSGPIRPNIECVQFVLNNYKNNSKIIILRPIYLLGIIILTLTKN